jgi:hypothetical protein
VHTYEMRCYCAPSANVNGQKVESHIWQRCITSLRVDQIVAFHVKRTYVHYNNKNNCSYNYLMAGITIRTGLIKNFLTNGKKESSVFNF